MQCVHFDMDPLELEERELDDEMDEGEGEEGEEGEQAEEEEEEELEEGEMRYVDASHPGFTFVPVNFDDAEDASDEEEEEEEVHPPQSSSPGSSTAGSTSAGNNEVKHQCVVCKSFFFTAAHLEQHVETAHRNVCAWTCQYCSAIFSDVEMFKLHLIKQHKSNKEIFTLDDPKLNPILDPAMSLPESLDSCPECNLQFSDANSLNLHRVRKHMAKRLTAGTDN